MELNELNSQLATLVNFGRANVSAPSTGEAFAQLLNRPERQERPVSENGKKEAAVFRSEAKEAKTDKKKDRFADNKINLPAEAKNNKRADNKKKEPTAAASETSATSDRAAAGERTEAPVSDKSTAVEQAVSPVEDNKPAVPSPDAAASAGEKSPDEMSVAAVVPLDLLALMGTINVLNPQTNEIVQMTGAELAAQLAGNDNVQVLRYNPENAGEPVFEVTLPAKNNQAVPQSSEDGLIDISMLQPVDNAELPEIDLSSVQAREVKKADTAKAGETTVIDFADNQLDEQAEKIAAIVGDGKKVSVNVTSDEEKIARLSAKDLLADAKVVDEAVSVSTKPADVSAKINVEASKQPAQTSAANNNNLQNLNAVPLYNGATQSAVQAAEVSAVPSAANVETAPLNLSASVAAGGEFVKAAKTDTAAEANQTSFRDVFKGMSREVVEQVKVNITKSAVKGIDKIDISLKPEDLGHIEVKMQIGKDGKLQAHIISSRPDTMDALQKEMQSLEKAFNDAGFQTDEGSLSFSFRDDGQTNQNQDRDSGLRNFIGDIFEKEASNDLLSEEGFRNGGWDGTSGLNIRV